MLFHPLRRMRDGSLHAPPFRAGMAGEHLPHSRGQTHTLHKRLLFRTISV